MIAVCRIGKPNGRLNSTTTAYEIGKAADRCGHREGGEKSKARLATAQEASRPRTARLAARTPPANHLVRPSAQSRVIARVEGR
jgi:hypothetical protein